MIATTKTARFDGMLEDLALRAAESGVPEGVVVEAREAVRAKFSAGVGARESQRLEAYFWGVVRRRALRGAAPRLGDTLVLASLAEELRGAGFGTSEVYAELRRVYGGRIDAALVDVYRPDPWAGRAA